MRDSSLVLSRAFIPGSSSMLGSASAAAGGEIGFCAPSFPHPLSPYTMPLSIRCVYPSTQARAVRLYPGQPSRVCAPHPQEWNRRHIHNEQQAVVEALRHARGCRRVPVGRTGGRAAPRHPHQASVTDIIRPPATAHSPPRPRSSIAAFALTLYFCTRFAFFIDVLVASPTRSSSCSLLRSG